MRIRALDGLRGLAAVVVLFHHSLLLFPSLAAAYFGAPVTGGLSRALVYTPLHGAWAGTEAVYLFFVLSGLVLALAAREFSRNWESYFTSRLVRLYLPVAGAVALAWVTFVAFPRTGVGHSTWLDVSARTYGLASMSHDLTLVNGVSNAVTPLWSLQWEVLFSLLLPVYLVVARRFALVWILAGGIAVSAAGIALGNRVLLILPMFALGVGLATYRDVVVERLSVTTIGWKGATAWSIAMVGGFALISANWWIPGPDRFVISAAAHIAMLIGICVMVVGAVVWRPWVRLLESRLVQWLGAISFSLYLTHEPLMKAAGFTFPGSRVAVVFAMVISLAVAWGFFVLVERPIHRLSRRMRKVAPAA